MLLTMVDRSRDETLEAIEQLRNHYGGKVFDTEIRKDASFEKAPSRNQDIFQYAPESQGAADYGKLLKEIEGRLERYGAVYYDLIEKANRTAKAPTTGTVLEGVASGATT